MSLRILFVTPYVPSSVRIRPFALIRELARRGHQVTLVCLVQPQWEARYLNEVTPFCQSVIPVQMERFEPYPRTFASLASPRPLSVAYCDSPAFRKAVINALRDVDFDLIHTEFVRAVPATESLSGQPKVLDLVDSVSLAYRRSITAAQVTLKQRAIAVVEWFKMRGYEKQALQHYQRVLVSSPFDRDAIGQDGAVAVLSNGVDLSYFSYRWNHPTGANIVFVGKMSYYVNVASVLWFYRNIFPKIREQIVDARFVIVGRDPSKSILALTSDPAVDVTGTVPDVRPYLEQAAVTVCPMVGGSGIQNKMLEAMALGAPCVATSMACQALKVQPGHEVFTADEPDEFANSVLQLISHADMARDVSVAGRCYVESCHDWQKVGAELENIYLDLRRN